LHVISGRWGRQGNGSLLESSERNKALITLILTQWSHVELQTTLLGNNSYNKEINICKLFLYLN
jgi:hypothetical protein